ncbi:hypothetical protein COT94_00390 [Candidatus Falkowbacteria bacterium CG10_big_fil_rev_8_21_14_0_10_37_14]|uniref:Uncharacterized protein n=1 Tax=Candidatus Falkowbacteria bacterium CG10_big_fil_rev_8_21_14_0_10_37_14 TaxID=1974561 RepID=A0A2M6WUE3_9BACT|nr:MAG: hypothetical protein COT94_00390 [Candidatus Falkowbacteria bacterium CG10_big_fil_rev_8_21_14_0_10_37_14]
MIQGKVLTKEFLKLLQVNNSKALAAAATEFTNEVQNWSEANNHAIKQLICEQKDCSDKNQLYLVVRIKYEIFKTNYKIKEQPSRQQRLKIFSLTRSVVLAAQGAQELTDIIKAWEKNFNVKINKKSVIRSFACGKHYKLINFTAFVIYRYR